MKTESQITSIEQSKRLLASGIDIDTASMVYTRFDSDDEGQYSVTPVVDEYTYDVPGRVIWPAWTIGDLIDLLPENIKRNGRATKLIITKRTVAYLSLCAHSLLEYRKHKNLIDNLVDAVIDICGNKKQKK